MLNRLQNVFASFASLEVKYLVIGGIAAVLYGVPRATFDLDILIEASPQNAKRLLTAMELAGLATATLTTPEELLANEITIFQDQVRIDVQTSTPGLVFAEAWERRQGMTYLGQSFWVASRADLIAAKKAAGRPKDLQDVEALEAGEPGPED